MAIATPDALIAGWQAPENFLKLSGTLKAAGAYHSLFYASGRPGAAVAPTSTIDGDALTTYPGQLPWHNPGAGETRLAHTHVCSSQPGSWKICDRLWHNATISVTTTTLQTISSPTWPARSRGASTGGSGVFIGLEVSAATTNAGIITGITITYKNSAGTSSQIGTLSTFPASAAAGQFFPFELAAGDYGVRKVEGLTLGTSLVTGTVHLVAYRPLLVGGVSLADRGETLDPITSGFPRGYDNTVPFILWQASATAAVTVGGCLVACQG